MKHLLSPVPRLPGSDLGSRAVTLLHLSVPGTGVGPQSGTRALIMPAIKLISAGLNELDQRTSIVDPTNNTDTITGSSMYYSIFSIFTHLKSRRSPSPLIRCPVDP